MLQTLPHFAPSSDANKSAFSFAARIAIALAASRCFRNCDVRNSIPWTLLTPLVSKPVKRPSKLSTLVNLTSIDFSYMWFDGKYRGILPIKPNFDYTLFYVPFATHIVPQRGVKKRIVTPQRGEMSVENETSKKRSSSRRDVTHHLIQANHKHANPN